MNWWYSWTLGSSPLSLDLSSILVEQFFAVSKHLSHREAVRRCLRNSGLITTAIWNKYNSYGVIVSELNVSRRNYNYFPFVEKLFWFVALMVTEFENLFLKQLILPSSMPNIQISSPKSFYSIMTASIAIIHYTLKILMFEDYI